MRSPAGWWGFSFRSAKNQDPSGVSSSFAPCCPWEQRRLAGGRIARPGRGWVRPAAWLLCHVALLLGCFCWF